MDPVRPRSYRPLILLLLGAGTIAWAPILVRWSELGDTSTAFWRLALASPVLTGAWLLRRAPEPRAPGGIALFLAAGIAFALDLACWHASIRLTTVANSTLFANFAPFLVALASWWLLAERFRAGFWIGLVLAGIGAALLVGRGVELDPARWRGDALGFATAVFYAGYILCVARLRRRYRATAVMAGTSAVAAVALLPLIWILGERVLPEHPAAWWPLVALAVGPHVLGQGAIAYALAFLPAAFGAVTLLFQPLVATLLAWHFFGESLGAIEALGAGAILVGIALAHLTRDDA